MLVLFIVVDILFCPLLCGLVLRGLILRGLLLRSLVLYLQLILRCLTKGAFLGPKTLL